jgi:hypothetical protein
MGSLAFQGFEIIMPHLAVSILILSNSSFTEILRKTIYPVFIILIVSVEKSQEEMKSANEMSLSQSIRFARIAASQASESLAEAANLGSSPEDTHFSGQVVKGERSKA